MKHHHRHLRLKGAPAPTASPAPLLHDEIAQCARELWLQQGSPENCDNAIWLEAESRLLATRQSAAPTFPALVSVP